MREPLYGVVHGHARAAQIYVYNDRHAARIVAREAHGVVVLLPVLDDFRVAS
jgi:hypothetical protein